MFKPPFLWTSSVKVFASKPCVLLGTLFIFTLISHSLVIFNPGFFNHDEWQRYDHIYSYDFAHFVEKVGVLKAGKEFGAPVRPLGFIQQGFSALFMVSHPWIAHLIDVLIHFFDMLVFYLLLSRLKVERRLKDIAALLFLLSPLGIFATAWVGASFDRLYVLFSMLAIYFALGIYQTNKHELRETAEQQKSIKFNGVGLFVSAFFAIISKETALMLPALVSLGYLLMGIKEFNLQSLVRDKYLYITSLLAGIPILIFLVIRAPAIYNTLFVYASPEYSPQFSFFLRNVLYYFAYPFYWGTGDMYSMAVESKVSAYIGALIHLSILFLLMWRINVKACAIYISLYFVFLLPVVFLQAISAHYLYATTPVMSLAIAYLIYDFLKSKNYLMLVVIGGLVLFSCYRFSQIQRMFYDDGVCQVRYISTLDANLASARVIKPIVTVNIQGDVGAKLYIAMRTVFGRSKNGPYKGLIFSSEKAAGYDLNLIMKESCEVNRM